MLKALCGALCALTLLTACGGGGSSTPAPTPPPVAQTPPPLSWSFSGVVTNALTGAPVSGATLTFTGRPAVTTAADGSWSLSGTGTQQVRQAVVISASGFLERETAVRWESGGRQDVAISLIPEASPFSLSYYREFVRNGLEAPGTLQPVRRWTTNPSFYVNTFNPRTSQPLEAHELALVVRALQEAVPQLSGGALSAAAIETGNGAREARSGVINVKFEYEPTSDYCGFALVGANPGEITINYDRCANVCGSLKVTPETIAHEVGHAMGFWHTSGGGVMSPTRSRRCANVDFSAAERLHARLAYLRPPGNQDTDRDPVSFLSFADAGDAPVVYCRR